MEEAATPKAACSAKKAIPIIDLTPAFHDQVEQLVKRQRARRVNMIMNMMMMMPHADMLQN